MRRLLQDPDPCLPPALHPLVRVTGIGAAHADEDSRDPVADPAVNLEDLDYHAVYGLQDEPHLHSIGVRSDRSIPLGRRRRPLRG